jgi:hypothetical protein
MSMSIKLARQVSRVAPTAKDKGLTCTIEVTVYDKGVTEVNGVPMWTEHPENGTAQAIACLLAEFYKDCDRRAKAQQKAAHEPK